MSKLFDLLNSVIAKLNIAVKAEPQNFSEEQKQLLRDNIGAASKDDAGGEQVQADWSQSDSESPDYIKNKPFYDNSHTSDDPTKLYFTCSGVCPIEGMTGAPAYGDLDISELYVVTFDGTPYEVVPVVTAYGYINYIGDPNYEQYPFSIDIHTDNMQDCYEYRVNSNLSGEHTVIVQPVVQDIKTLDRKFFPDIRSDWSENNPISPNYVQNRSHYDEDISRTVFSEISVDADSTMEFERQSDYIFADTKLILTLAINDGTAPTTYTLKSLVDKNNRTFVEVEDICTILLPTDDYPTGSIINHRPHNTITVSLEAIYGVHKLDNKFIDCTDIAEKYNMAPISSQGVYTALLNSQPNWHTNNKKSINYTDCRPFYDSSDYEIILPTREFTSTFIHFIDRSLGVHTATRFLIIFDGIEYVVDYSILEWGMYFHKVCEFDKYPFKLEFYDLASVTVAAKETGTHTICVLATDNIGEVITLADRYIPNTIARVSDLPITEDELDILMRDLGLQEE